MCDFTMLLAVVADTRGLGGRIISRVRRLLTWINANCSVTREFVANSAEHVNGKPCRQVVVSSHRHDGVDWCRLGSKPASGRSPSSRWQVRISRGNFAGRATQTLVIVSLTVTGAVGASHDSERRSSPTSTPIRVIELQRRAQLPSRRRCTLASHTGQSCARSQQQADTADGVVIQS